MNKLAFRDKVVAAQVSLVTLEWEGDYTGQSLYNFQARDENYAGTG